MRSVCDPCSKMEASQCQRGKCCAGELCNYEHLELRECHKCTVWHQVVHVLCGHGSNNEDSLLICKLCHQTTEMDNDLQNMANNQLITSGMSSL